MLATIQIHDDSISLLDQRRLPLETVYIPIKTAQQAYDGIKDMVVRGAPAIGVTAAFGFAFGARDGDAHNESRMADMRAMLLSARPTAVNLRWGLEKQWRLYKQHREGAGAQTVFRALFDHAVSLYHQDIATNKRMGDWGQTLLPKGARIITHCNAGALATCGWGTALGVIRSAYAQGKVACVFADETRPYLQGARLTAWELQQDNIPVRVIVDGSAAHMIQTQGIQAAIVGADRIAANGDVANKIGTFGLAIACRFHGIPFYVAAPLSTFDLNLDCGADIPIEQRAADEVRFAMGARIFTDSIAADNPSFDVTPAGLVSAIICEKGIVAPVNRQTVAAMCGD